MPNIYISYRKIDSQKRAHRIANWLARKYGKKNIFIDVGRIPDRSQIADVIEKSIEQSDVIVIVIGNDWVSQIENRLALSEPDFVRQEARQALNSTKLILPVLLHRGVNIDPKHLPEDVRNITRLNYMFARSRSDFQTDMQRIQLEIDRSFSRRKLPFAKIAFTIVALIGIMFLLSLASTTNPETDPLPIPITQISTLTSPPTKTERPSPTSTPSATATTTLTSQATKIAQIPTKTVTVGVTFSDGNIDAVQAQRAKGEQKATEIFETINAPSTVAAIETAVAEATSQAQATEIQLTSSIIEVLQIIETQNVIMTANANTNATLTAIMNNANTNATLTAVAGANNSGGTGDGDGDGNDDGEETGGCTNENTLSRLVLAKIPVASNVIWTPYSCDFDGVTMVLVPVGCFMMGDPTIANVWGMVHQQCLDEPFWIDKYEVTNDQFGSVGCGDWSSGSNQPRSCTNWFETKAFCENRGGRLPTEKEWEYAARGPDNLVYPWGNDWNENYAVTASNSGGQTAEVGSRPSESVSWVGAMDMSGNVYEWTTSLWKSYPYGDDHEDLSNTTSFRVGRGGSWFHTNFKNFKTSHRNIGKPDENTTRRGFRCVRSL